MSAPSPNPPAEAPAADSPRTRVGGLLKRMKSALKMGKSTPNTSTEPTASVVEPVPIGEEAAAGVATPGSTAPPPPPAEATAAHATIVPTDSQLDHGNQPATESEPVVVDTAQEEPPQYRVTRQQLWEDRAQHLLEKYNLSMEPGIKPLALAVDPTAIVERVKKPVRMRVHRRCHHCNTVFGPDRICASCEHRRCKKCPRYPPEASASRDASRARRSKAAREEQHTMSREPLLVIQNPQTGGHILVHNRIVQRIRRSCHKCEAEFVPPTAKTCPECSHARCSRCPRTPVKLDKWNQGYPGQAEGSSDEDQQPHVRKHHQERVFRKPRQRVRWNCDQCSRLFLEGQKTCEGCGHEKCEGCRRSPYKKNRQDFDPEIVRALNEKLSALVIGTQAS